MHNAAFVSSPKQASAQSRWTQTHPWEVKKSPKRISFRFRMAFGDLERVSGTHGHSYWHTAGICVYPIPLALLPPTIEELAHAPPDRDDRFAGLIPFSNSTLPVPCRSLLD